MARSVYRPWVGAIAAAVWLSTGAVFFAGQRRGYIPPWDSRRERPRTLGAMLLLLGHRDMNLILQPLVVAGFYFSGGAQYGVWGALKRVGWGGTALGLMFVYGFVVGMTAMFKELRNNLNCIFVKQVKR